MRLCNGLPLSLSLAARRGYFERRDVVSLNTTLLASSECTCFVRTEHFDAAAVPPIPRVVFDAGAMNLLEQLR